MTPPGPPISRLAFPRILPTLPRNTMQPPIQVKICGITNPADALAAVDAGADALGFNLFPGSKRYIPLAELAAWLPSLPAGALRVALMVNPSVDEFRSICTAGFDVVQLHGQESPDYCARIAAGVGVQFWKAFPMTAELDAATVASYAASAVLLDSSVPGAFGGTGKLIDLDLAAAFVRSCADRRVWLSGGLNPSNVAEAVKRVSPYGVDVSSGVEVAGDPRRKDAALLRAFVYAARAAKAAA